MPEHSSGEHVYPPTPISETENKKSNYDQILDFINSGEVDELARSFYKFTELGPEVATALLAKGWGWLIAENLEKFQGLDHSDIAHKIIGMGDGHSVARYFDKFRNIDHSDVALKLIETEQESALQNYFHHFYNLKSEVATKLIELGNFSFVHYLDRFADIDHSKLALQLCDIGKSSIVVNNIHTFQNLNTEVALKLIKAGCSFDVAIHLQNFQRLSTEVALELIEKGNGLLVATRLDRFRVLTTEVVSDLVERDFGPLIVQDLSLFPERDHQNIANILIGHDEGELVIDNLKEFKGVRSEVIATMLIETNQANLIIDKFDKFQELDTQELLQWIKYKPAIRQAFESNPSLQTFVESTQRLKPFITCIEDMLKGRESSLLNHPELTGQLKANEQYGHLLISKFGELDKHAQRGILELIYNAEQIQSENITSGKPFRQKMQEMLSTYESNPETLRVLEDSTQINVEQWLNFDYEHTFTLESSGELETYREGFELALGRICDETIRYHDLIKSAVAPFKPELQKSKLPGIVPKELLEQQRKLEDKIQTPIPSGVNSSKIESMKAALQKLEIKIEAAKAKTISEWDKFNGDISAIRLAAIKTLENIPSDRGHRLSPQSVDSFRNQSQQIARQFQKLRTKILPSLEKTLGQERLKAITQEIDQSFAVGFDHLHTDLEAIMTLHEQSKHRTNPLEGRVMKIKLWDRNPTTNLYLGNYTNCCVRIDSDYHGSESPIVDYILDPAIQVMLIEDEQTKQPIVAAWLYLGKQGEDSEDVALVIDNIEANIDYSGPFAQQLEKETLAFLSRYAQASNLNKISQGEDNNDLIVAELETKYEKLGKYNRPDGYYLEAEPGNDDETVWDDDDWDL
jgi:hypothetical protein